MEVHLKLANRQQNPGWYTYILSYVDAQFLSGYIMTPLYQLAIYLLNHLLKD